MIVAHRVRQLRSWLTVLGVGLIVAGLHAVAAADDETSATAVTVQPATSSASFTRRPYVGIGVGVSRLKPRTHADALDIAETQDTGGHFMLGYDLSRWLSAEVYFADLGAAEVDFLAVDVGPVEYQVYGVSGIGYLFNSRSGLSIGNKTTGLFRREGLSLYGRVGLGGIRNESELSFERDHPLHVAFGVGLEYGFSNGIAVRGELMSFDTDAQYASVSLLKRFGDVRAVAPAAVAAVIPPEPVADAVPKAVVPEGPTMFQPVVPPYIYFDFDKAVLKPEAITKLDEFVLAVRDNDMEIQLDGHTDWIDTERYNHGLSLRRATTVRDYLVKNGIDDSRTGVEGFGETRPISTNLTDEGRAQNRRVEVRLH